MKPLLKVSVLTALGATCVGAIAAEKSKATQPKEFSAYKSWQRVNPKPLRLPNPTSSLCIGPTLSRINPHRGYWFTVYVNPKGSEAMRKPKAPVFPVGTMIVKEKLKEKTSTEPELRTVMIKRERGFDKKAGDWEYLVIDDKGDVTRDAIIRGEHTFSHCRSCHEQVKASDYVFRTYLPKPAPKA